MTRAKVALISPEIEPLAKTGGLADMLGSFSHALVKLGEDPALFLPQYRCIPAPFLGEQLGEFQVRAAGREFPVRVRAGRIPSRARVYLIDIPELFDRAGIYGEAHRDYPDNCLRYAVYCRSVLEYMTRLGCPWDILHCHDWQTSLAAIYLKTIFADAPCFAKARSLLTLHNMAYQGIFPAADFPILGLEPRHFHSGFLEYFQKISLLKGGIVAADALTTVSPTYAKEVLGPELGFGMDGVLKPRQDRFWGILNGIDEEEWDPERSPDLPCHFSAEDLAGKSGCKSALQRELGLPVAPDLPLIGTISRLVDQKGIDLLLAAVPQCQDLELQWVVLGNGEAHLEAGLSELAGRLPGRVAVRIGYDPGLAQRITAGADFLAMPSRFEPCGYNQLYALRYGAIPIVHGIGGLKDSVRDWRQEPERGTGIVLPTLGVEPLRGALAAAVQIFHDRELFEGMRRRGMREDFTWKNSAQQYLEIYQRLQALPRTPLPG
ncbi:MAG: glycogen synthase GlgA [bacterium]